VAAVWSERRIYDAYIAARQSAALAAAVRVGLFELLDREPLSPDDAAARLGLERRPVRLLMRVLRAMGLLEGEGVRLAPTADARAHLVRGRPGWLGGLIELEVENFPTPERVLEALRSDRASVYGGADPWASHAHDPGRARAFTEAMHSLIALPAAALAEQVDFSAARRVLDVGGGSGAVAIALARAWPELRCTILDLPSVCELAREFIEAAGVEDRVTTQGGDMLGEPFPGGHDVVIFSQILHDWPPEVCADLVASAYRALGSGGRVLVHEKLVSDGGPLANALVDVDMLVWTQGQQWDAAGLRVLLESAGFRGVEVLPTYGYWSAITASKP
jgi:SAM-dependent methyltransferase